MTIKATKGSAAFAPTGPKRHDPFVASGHSRSDRRRADVVVEEVDLARLRSHAGGEIAHARWRKKCSHAGREVAADEGVVSVGSLALAKSPSAPWCGPVLFEICSIVVITCSSLTAVHAVLGRE